MKGNRWERGSFVAILVLVGSASSPGSAIAQAGREAEVRGTIEEFVSAWKAGDTDRLRAVTAADGNVLWVSGDGEEATVNSMTFASIAERGRSQEVYELVDIHSVDIVDEELAVAKVEIRWSAGTYIDYYVLYHVAGAWRVANKSYVVRRD